MRPLFYTGVHHPQMAQGLERAMVSINTLENRKSDFRANLWILDSGAFTRVSRGLDHMPVDRYAKQVHRWPACGKLEACVAQDWMCEPMVLRVTGLTIAEHQRMSTRRWLELREAVSGIHVMPVIQRWNPQDYTRHLDEMGPELPQGTWVGVGSVCKRQGSPRVISAILTAILKERPDLKLHGFGVKTRALRRADISQRFHSVDSMAWSYAARRMTPQASNSLKFAREWTDRVNNCPIRTSQAAFL